MTKWFLLGLLCVTSPIYATSGMEHLYLKITVKNDTPNACRLYNKTLKHGAISNLTALPDTIPAGKERMLFIYENPIFGSDISLSYYCGDDRTISLNSQRDAVIRGANTTGSIGNIHNMDATYDVLPGTTTIFGDKPGSVYWTLY